MRTLHFVSWLPGCGASPTVRSPVRPTSHRLPSTPLPKHLRVISFPVTREACQNVPVKTPPVVGASPTPPSAVRPSSHRLPGVVPKHLRWISSLLGEVTKITSHLVPVKTPPVFGASPTLPSAVRPSKKKWTFAGPVRHSRVILSP